MNHSSKSTSFPSVLKGSDSGKGAYGSFGRLGVSPTFPLPAGAPEKKSPQVTRKRISSSLVFKKNNRNKFCGRYSVKGRLQEGGKEVLHFSRLGCKMWSCPACGQKRVRRLKHAIIEKALERKLSRFLTLTLDPKACSPEESVSYIRECWRKFRIYLKRKHGFSITFISVVEFQKSGYAHLHVLVDRFIQQSWLSSEWEAVGGGRIVHIKQVDIHRIAPYLSKYLTKEVLLGGFKPKQRRYSTSRDILLFVKQPSGQWIMIRASIDCLYSLAKGRVSEEKWDDNGMLQNFRIEK